MSNKEIEPQIEWNMAKEEMFRIAEIVRSIEEIAYHVRLGRFGYLAGYYSALQNLFFNIYPVARKFKITKEQSSSAGIRRIRAVLE